MWQKEHLVGGDAWILVLDLCATISFPFAEGKFWQWRFFGEADWDLLMGFILMAVTAGTKDGHVYSVLHFAVCVIKSGFLILNVPV